MKFPYLSLGHSFMPVIPITLARNGRCIVTEALVDSGATSSIFNAQFAWALGISEIRRGKKVFFEGVTGDTMIGYLHEITLIVGGRPFKKRMIAFSEDMPESAVNILGQEGFFDLLTISFNNAEQEIDIDL